MLNTNKFRIKQKLVALTDQKGATLLEVCLSIGLVGIVVTAVLLGLSTSFKSTVLANKQATAISLAQKEADNLTRQPYNDNISDYNRIELTNYSNYSIILTPLQLIPNGSGQHDALQKITISVLNAGSSVYSINIYKVE